MKKLIIAIVMSFMALTMNGQNYFSKIEVTNEFGQVQKTAINGRITINDNAIIIKTPKGVYDIVEVQEIEKKGTKDNPEEIEGHFYYGTRYFGLDHNKKPCCFAQRIFVTEIMHSYVETIWIIWRFDDDNEVIETVAFYN